MILSDRWEVQGGQGDYVLIETRMGTNPKTKEPTTTEHRTYHPSLELCAKKIAKVVGINSVEAESIDQVIERLEFVRREILNFMQDATH